MTMEEGPPGPMLVRLFCFVSAAVICTMAINKWREIQRQSVHEHQQQQHLQRRQIQSPNSLQSSTK
uniref:Uncharacterized protein n=1 Tax=Rhizophora mucronata TaxID=61149 RepID=A0A2P2MSX7_RHIMU